MMSLETIRAMSDERAEIAARERMVPYLIYSRDELDTFPGGDNYVDRNFPFPNIGSHEPDGYDKITELFVDSSGFGEPGEPALTASQFINELKDLYDEHGAIACAITMVGQFQVYITVYKRSYK